MTIKREDHGLASQHLHDSIKPGDSLQVAAAAGRFTFTGDQAPRVALLAAGVGITPLMSILRYLADQHWPGQIYLVFYCKTPRDIIFRDELQALQTRCPNLHLTITLTRAQNTDWTGPLGRIDAPLLTRTIPNLTNLPFYLCGPAEMLHATHDLLTQLGIPENHIHIESFGTPRTAPASTDATFNITFQRSAQTAAIPATLPILDLADQLQIGVDSECRSGLCGRCKCQLLSGSVHMPTQDALTSADRQNNIILLCQARPLSDVTLNA